ncbi:hypothetical protein EVG20_g7167 [Dentipellis fragilis]|uniref:COQ9 C-terminal domain-containing protein n=1 Tax=Dentipellis fragilis TaxID=205917 RepID=A0A4Y9YHE4_9AGAM|nr:hypothetical protein EVG20_g7167 [Dentipellis fragilis]
MTTDIFRHLPAIYVYLKGAVPKTATQKILLALSEKGQITQKTYELSKLKSTPTDAELAVQIDETSIKAEQLRKHLEPLHSRTPLVDAEALAALDREWTKWRAEWSTSAAARPAARERARLHAAVSALFGEGDNAWRTLIQAWLEEGRVRMRTPVPSTKDALRARLHYNEPALAHLPEAFALLASPQYGIPPLDIRPAFWHTAGVADEACYAAKEPTIGLSWYSRRASLAAVLMVYIIEFKSVRGKGGGKGGNEECADADIIEVEVDKPTESELREGRRSRIWNGVPGMHQPYPGGGAPAMVGPDGLEEGEVRQEVLQTAQLAVLALHPLLQACVSHSSGVALPGIPMGAPLPPRLPIPADAIGGQATLASIIARAQMQNMAAGAAGQRRPTDASEPGPSSFGVEWEQAIAPSQENSSTSQDVEEMQASDMPSLSMYGLSDEQAKMLEQAIANAAAAAQLQAEAEAALEEDEEEEYDDEDDEDDDDGDMERVDVP